MPARDPHRPGTVPSGRERHEDPLSLPRSARRWTGSTHAASACRPYRVAKCWETRQPTQRTRKGKHVRGSGDSRYSCRYYPRVAEPVGGGANSTRSPSPSVPARVTKPPPDSLGARHPALIIPCAKRSRSSSSPPVRHSRIQSPASRRSSAPATSAISSESCRAVSAPKRRSAKRRSSARSSARPCAMPCSRARSSTRAPHSIARASINAGGSFPSRLASNTRSISASACSRPCSRPRSSTRASHSIARASINVGISLPPRLASNARSISASGGNLSPPCGVREYLTRA